jgi:lipopolysaccharide transport system permease protein
MDFLISALILAVLLLCCHDLPTWRVLLLPLFTLLAFLSSFGTSLWLAALNVKYRDFRYIIPFIVQFGLYAAPVGYGSAEVAQKIGAKCGTYADYIIFLYNLNPMVGVINCFRWAFGSTVPFDTYSLLISVDVTLLLIFSGIKYFRATEKVFADII